MIKSFNKSDVGQLPEISRSPEKNLSSSFGNHELRFYNSRSSTDLGNMSISESQIIDRD